MKKTAVVILNWNGVKLLEKFLPSVVMHTSLPNTEIWVIDNASSDHSVEFIKQNFSDVKIICLDKNYGFTGGYNRGLKEIAADYFLLLNSDIEVTDGWFEPLFNLMENNPDVGICGPVLLDYNHRNKYEYAGAAGGFIDKYGYPFCRGRIFDSIEFCDGQYDTNIDCFWISGAALMIRAELYKTSEGLDEAFFAHMEEIDLCWRVQNLGFRVICMSESIVYHLGGATLSANSPRKTFYNFRNNLSLLFKNLTFWILVKVLIIRFYLDQLAAVKFLSQGNVSHFFAVFRAYISFIFSIPRLIRQRKQILKRSVNSLSGFYNGSIIYNYYIKKIRFFEKLF